MQNRRHFLGQCSALAATAALCPSESLLQAAPAPTRPVEGHFFKLSLAAYSFNRQLSRNWPKPGQKKGMIGLEQFIDFCGQQNIDACELTSYYFDNPLSMETINQLKQRAFLAGLDISGTAIGNDFCHPAGESREQQLKLTRDWIDYAAALGAPVIRIFAGKQKKKQSYEEALEQCVSGINESLEYAEKKGVILALENHGGITATPEQLLKIVDQVKSSPCFGINFDSGNFRTKDPYGDLEQIAPYAVNAQLKIEMHADGKTEKADFPRIINILKQASYRGYVVLEYEGKDDPWTSIPPYLNQLKELIA